MDVWGKLWDAATSEPGGAAHIELTDDPGTVVLVWPDGSRGTLHWDNGDWRHADRLNACPGDVAARDSL